MRDETRRPGRLSAPAIAALALLALPSCGGEDAGRPKRYAAGGKVLVDGKAESGIKIRLHPIDRPHDVDSLQPAGVTNAEGYYRLGTYEQEDGAPTGRYKATLFWPDTPDPTSRPKDLFGGAYAKPESSPFDITITDGENRLADVEATKSGRVAKPRSPARKAVNDAGPGPDGP